MSKLDALCESMGVVADPVLVDRALPEGFDPQANAWDVTLTVDNGREMRTETFAYYTGSAITEDPSAADVLYALILEADALDLTFGEWCGEFGYDEDSRKALDLYVQCQENGRRVRALLGDAFGRFQVAAEDH